MDESTGFFTRKKTVIFILLAIILVVEAVWAFRFLSSQGKGPIESITSVIPQETIATMSIDPSQVTVAVGSQFTSSISVDVARREVNGMDAVIKYDSQFLEVVESANGDLFENLLVNEIDSDNGTISITASRLSPETPPININGILAVINFQALTAGSTQIEIVFDPNQTSNSNVTEAVTSDNILTTVSNAQVTIAPQ